MKTPYLPTLALAAFIATGATTLVSAQTVQNGSFESPTVPADPGYTTEAPAPYIFVNPGPISANAGLSTTTAGSPADGSQDLYINTNAAIDDPKPYVYQDAGAIQANTIYTLTVAESAGQYMPGVDDFTISLYNNTSPTDATLLNSTSATLTTTSATNSFVDSVVSFTTGSSVSGDLTFALIDSTGKTNISGGQDDFDNVRLSAVPVGDVPEPMTPALLGDGPSRIARAVPPSLSRLLTLFRSGIAKRRRSFRRLFVLEALSLVTWLLMPGISLLWYRISPLASLKNRGSPPAHPL